MSHTLISFLGKANKDAGGKYRTANYDFDTQIQTTQFFGLGLLEVIKPQKFIVLGTSGSMWDVFYEKFAESEIQEEHWMALNDSVLINKVTQEQLDACAIDLTQQLNLPCTLKLIPYGMDEKEQSEILEIMAKDVHAEDQVSLDLTHGLRHLPMLGLLSAMYLQTLKQVSINGIYYGALELTENEKTPVMRLDGLLKIADWINALHGFDKTGDIAPFSKLLQQEGMVAETAELLNVAAFHESVLNITSARKPLRDFAKQTHNNLPGLAELFSDSLNERISWKDQDNIYLRQREKAQFYLQQGDYVRAASLGYEALITFQIKKTNPSAETEDYETRQDAKDDLEYEFRSKDPQKWRQYKLLRGIRNSIAHTNRADTKEVKKAFSNEQNLKEILLELFDVLLPKTMN